MGYFSKKLKNYGEKILRRRGEHTLSYTIIIEETNETFVCQENENLLRGMERLGKVGIPVGCRGGGCGVCKVQITHGDYSTHTMSLEHVSKKEQQDRIALACKVIPQGHLKIKVIGLMKKNVCRSKPEASGWLDKMRQLMAST